MSTTKAELLLCPWSRLFSNNGVSRSVLFSSYHGDFVNSVPEGFPTVERCWIYPVAKCWHWRLHSKMVKRLHLKQVYCSDFPTTIRWQLPPEKGEALASSETLSSQLLLLLASAGGITHSEESDSRPLPHAWAHRRLGLLWLTGKRALGQQFWPKVIKNELIELGHFNWIPSQWSAPEVARA